MKPIKLTINTQFETYPIIIGSNLIKNLAIYLKKNSINFNQCLLIIDKNIPKRMVSKITKSLKIPTIGIGASVNCDGQILVTDDMLGLSGFYPRFVKKFARLNNIIEKGVQKYNKAVLTKKFPSKKNSF